MHDYFADLQKRRMRDASVRVARLCACVLILGACACSRTEIGTVLGDTRSFSARVDLVTL